MNASIDPSCSIHDRLTWQKLNDAGALASFGLSIALWVIGSAKDMMISLQFRHGEHEFIVETRPLIRNDYLTSRSTGVARKVVELEKLHSSG